MKLAFANMDINKIKTMEKIKNILVLIIKNYIIINYK